MLRTRSTRSGGRSNGTWALKAAKTLKGTRFCLLKHPARLKPGEKRRLAALRRQNRALDRAYELKEYLAIILEQATPDEAPDMLDQWLAWAARSRLAPFVKLARTVRKHAAGILAYLNTKMTNGPVEGFNNKLRVIARRATASTRTARSSPCCFSAAAASNWPHPYPHAFEEIRSEALVPQELRTRSEENSDPVVLRTRYGETASGDITEALCRQRQFQYLVDRRRLAHRRTAATAFRTACV